MSTLKIKSKDGRPLLTIHEDGREEKHEDYLKLEDKREQRRKRKRRKSGTDTP